MTINFRAPGRALHDEIARSHPSLLRGEVRCPKCSKTRTVDPAKCLQSGWPKCSCGGGVSIDNPAKAPPAAS